MKILFDQYDFHVEDKFYQSVENQQKLFDHVKKYLSEHAVSDVGAYALGTSNVENRYCLHYEEGLWVCYFFEKGKRHFPCFFSKPRDAVNFLIWRLLKVPSINWKDITN